MNINKAIGKQRKSYIRFLLSMCFVFFALPLALIFYSRLDAFYLGYLAAVEMLVVVSVYMRSRQERLEFEYNMGRLRVKRGLSAKTESINCDKIMYVDVELAAEKVKGFQEFSIILISKSKFRNKKLKEVDGEFWDRYISMWSVNEKLVQENPGKDMYYLIIDSGGLRKYRLLDAVFTSCVKAAFSENAIEKIKFYRKSINS
jgi:hypothetical protein